MACPIKFNSEVVDFINQHNLGYTCFLMLSNMLKIYSKLVSIDLEVDYWIEDGEDDNVGHIVFRLVLESDQQTCLKDYDNYVGWCVNNIAPDDLCFFVETIERI